MCVLISPKVRIGSNCVRHESYIVFRISRQKKQREKNTGLEANPNAGTYSSPVIASVSDVTCYSCVIARQSRNKSVFHVSPEKEELNGPQETR